MDISTVKKLKELTSELEYERATSLFLQLRKLEKEDIKYIPIRQHLKSLIVQYENKYWNDEEKITNEQIQESDFAEELVQAENKFYQDRKHLVKDALKNVGLSQQELGKILGHSKSYISELINGLRPFSKEDIVVIHRLFDISYDLLIPPFIKNERVIHIKKILKSHPNISLKLKKQDFSTNV